jgi:hypothetical protein
MPELGDSPLDGGYHSGDPPPLWLWIVGLCLIVGLITLVQSCL